MALQDRLMRRTEYLILLGLDDRATAEDIKAAYWNRARQLHPDINPTPEAHEAFRSLTEAYRALRAAPPHHLPVKAEPVRAKAWHIPRAIRGRWAGATAFSVSILGALIALNAALRTNDPAPRESEAKVVKATVSMPAPRAAVATLDAAPTATIPPILMGSSKGRAAGPWSPPQPTAPAAPPRVANADPTQGVPAATPAKAAPATPKPMVAKPVVPAASPPPVASRPAAPAANVAVRPAPFARRAAMARPFAAKDTNVRPRERMRPVRNASERALERAAPVQASPRPAPRAPTIDALAGSIVRSVLGD